MPPAPRLTLYVCKLGEDGPSDHECRMAAEALRDAGHNFEKLMLDQPKPGVEPAGVGRAELFAATGQEWLPALKLTDGTTVLVGIKPIRGWTTGNDRTSIGKPPPTPGLPSGRPKEDC